MDLFDHARTADGEFEIKRGIPVTNDRATPQYRAYKRPDFAKTFSRMQVGDCFDCTPAQCGHAPLIVTQNMVSGAAATFAKNYPGPGRPKFTTRQVRGEFVRCWRIA